MLSIRQRHFHFIATIATTHCCCFFVSLCVTIRSRRSRMRAGNCTSHSHGHAASDPSSVMECVLEQDGFHAPPATCIFDCAQWQQRHRTPFMQRSLYNDAQSHWDRIAAMALSSPFMQWFAKSNFASPKFKILKSGIMG